MRILIADDDGVAVQTLSALVKAARYDVSVATDAMQAVMVAMRDPPDGILLDITAFTEAVHPGKHAGSCARACCP